MYILDTCICIDFLKGRLPNTRDAILEKSPSDFALPAIVRSELLLGPLKTDSKRKQRVVEQFCDAFELLPFDQPCADAYAMLRAHMESQGNCIGPNDLIIAATALAHNATLVTRNVDEFSRVPLLRVEDWEEADLL